MKMPIKILFSLCLFLFLTSAAFAQDRTDTDDNDFSTWDSNTDRRIDNNEFNNNFRDNDPYMDWDANNDNRLDENEWNDNFTSYYEGRDVDDGLFDDWDRNDDSYLDENEYRDGTFDLWDANDDNFLDENEYGEWYNDDDID